MINKIYSQDYEDVDTDVNEKIPEFTQSVECRTLPVTTTTMVPTTMTTRMVSSTTVAPGANTTMMTTTTPSAANRMKPMVLLTVFMAALFRFIF